jgi:hypothetical protein
MEKLALTPDQAGYNLRERREVISVALDGGASRYRKDVINPASLASVQWTLSKAQYQYFRSFFKQIVSSGALPFAIDLVMESGEPEEYTAYFVPESISVSPYNGFYYTVSADLEVLPATRDTEQEGIYAMLFGAYGDDYEALFPVDESAIDFIINNEFARYGTP